MWTRIKEKKNESSTSECIKVKVKKENKKENKKKESESSTSECMKVRVKKNVKIEENEEKRKREKHKWVNESKS